MENSYSDPSKKLDNVIDLKQIFYIFWDNKIKILSISIFLSIIVTSISYLFPNQYTSSAILAPTSGNSKLSQFAGQYSGIANLVGFDLGGNETDEIFQGIEIVKSLDFFESVIEKKDLFFKLFAVKGWDSSKNELLINGKFFDESKGWIYEGPFSYEGKPSKQSSHRKFLKNFSISRDKITGIIYISYKHYSPYVAKELLETIIYEINEYKRVRDREEAKKTIAFLEKELQNTNIVNVKIGINGLIQKKIEEVALTNVAPQYFIKTISTPNVPELKTSPKRSLILITSFITFFVLIYLVFFSIKFANISRSV